MILTVEPLATTGLIFGGCCTNVFALERIVNLHPSSGLVITFFQFAFTTCFAYLTQFEAGAPYSVRTPTVPLSRWGFIAFMFFAINMMNNWAFAYNISVPVHIILRSFGSVWTMLAGMIRGKRFSALQIFSVVLLTAGVLTSAWADSRSKGKSMAVEGDALSTEFAQGVGILLVAQLMSAYMGAYTEDTYAKYDASWTENLFYSHFLSLPFFLPLSGPLRDQYRKLAATSPLILPRSLLKSFNNDSMILELLFKTIESVPKGVLFLFMNAVTQLACISGVNLLSARSSAVTVTIVLNIRKLVSFILSTVIFGHKLDAMMIVGATLVFGSGGLYGYETSWRLPGQRRALADSTQSRDAKKKD